MVVLVMGVAGSGKSVVGAALAKALHWRFVDADSFHSAENISRMARGVALTDADRGGWLHALGEAVKRWNAEGQNVVLACSALKVSYRDQLAVGQDFRIVYLKGTFDLIHGRIATRPDHFMKPEMLASQFADLEEPEDAIVIDVSRSPEEIVAEIERVLGAARKRNGRHNSQH